MATPTFSVGVDADPMLVEQTIDKTLDQIIKERRESKGAAGKRGKAEAGTGKKDAARKAGQVAKSVGTAKAKREALLAKKRGISASAKPEPAQVEAKVQRTKTKQANKKALKEAEVLVASSRGVSKAKAKKIKAKAAAAAVKAKATAAQEKRGGARPGGKKQGSGPGGPKQGVQNAKNMVFNVGVKGGKRQQKQGGQKQEQQQAPVGRRGRRRRGGAGGSGSGSGAGSGGASVITAAQPAINAATNSTKSRRKNKKGSAGAAGGGSSKPSTFTPDRNIQISFHSGGGGGGRGGINNRGTYVFGSPNGVGRLQKNLGKSFSSALASSSPTSFNNGVRNGGGSRNVGGRSARYTPPPRTTFTNSGQSRRMGPKDFRRPQLNAADRMATAARKSRASTMDSRRKTGQVSFNYNSTGGGNSRGGGGGGRNTRADRRVIILGNGH